MDEGIIALGPGPPFEIVSSIVREMDQTVAFHLVFPLPLITLMKLP